MAILKTSKKRKELLQWLIIIFILAVYTYYEATRKEEIKKPHTAKIVTQPSAPSPHYRP